MYSRIDFPLSGQERLQARFVAPRQYLRADRPGELSAVLAAAEQAAVEGRWVVGFVTYEAAPAFDPALIVQSLPEGQPLALFAVYDEPALDDDGQWPAEVALPDFFCKRWSSSLDEEAATRGVEAIRQGIAAGDFYQVNLTMRASSPFAGSPEALFNALASSQPGAYLAYLDWGEGQVLSVSPELFFQRVGPTLTTRPMKGTAPRHADPALDRAAAEDLYHSPKERAENLMIVDLLRNDLARVAATGSVRVPALFEVAALPSVWQMTSTVVATAAPDIGLPEIFAALFPCGSVTGAPKVAAMAAIARLEDSPRGVYCGAIGVLRPGGDAVFSVGIRTVSVANGVATCGLGSGITIDSSGNAEHAEWIAKRRFLFRAAAPFELLETMRLENGEFVRLDAHLERLRAGAAWFGFAFDEVSLAEALAHAAAAGAPVAQRVRLCVARDGTLRIETFPLDAVPDDVMVRLADAPIRGALEFLQHKTTERTAYAPFIEPPGGVFDTLLFNVSGELTEFTRGNLFIESAEGGIWLTPPVSSGLLPGVLRGELIATGLAREAVLRREDLAKARRILFGNSLRGLLETHLIS